VTVRSIYPQAPAKPDTLALECLVIRLMPMATRRSRTLAAKLLDGTATEGEIGELKERLTRKGYL
jgi:hypothetical protein